MTEFHSWNPPYREAITNGHDVPPRRAQRDAHEPIRVRARLLWERSGEEWIDTFALGWTRDLVLVQVDDRRWNFSAVWLGPADVVRVGQNVGQNFTP